MPRTSGEQYGVTTQESAADAQPGDLVFFGSYGSDHVGIYTGNGNMINAETVDGVTSRQISVMEKYLGPASYGRVNGATQAAFNGSATDSSTQASTNDDSYSQSGVSTTNNNQAPADTNNDSNSQSTTPTTDNSSSDNNQDATDNNGASSESSNQTNNANQAPTSNGANADVNNNQNNDITSVEPEKTDVKPVDNQVVKVVTPTNQKDTLPATGETKNSLLTVIGLGLISFVTLLGFKIRKNN